MATLKPQQSGRPDSKGIWDFFDRNWQGIAVILAVVAIFVWYQALNLGGSMQKAIDNATQPTTTTKPTTTTPPATTVTPPASKTTPAPVVKPAPTPAPTPKTTKPVSAPTPTPAPQVSQAGAYSQVAKRGQGVTHLARQALDGYLASAKPQITLSREQKIYIEDYLKHNSSVKHVITGKTLNFSEDMLKQGIERAQKLSPGQVKNLTKYANRVPSLKPYSFK